jgi:hypothetical protein
MGILTGRTTCLGQEPVGWSSFRGKRTMANDDKPLKEGSGGATRGKTKSVTERPFDMWLQKQLHAMYDEIASEPLPEDLLNLIERDAQAEKGPEREGKK